MHVSRKEAESEAVRIAEEFIAASTPEMRGECIDARPDILSPCYKRRYKGRKTIIKWSVIVRWTLEDGGIIDGDSILKVDIETKEAEWMPP